VYFRFTPRIDNLGLGKSIDGSPRLELKDNSIAWVGCKREEDRPNHSAAKKRVSLTVESCHDGQWFA
jgi:hypothetical protein